VNKKILKINSYLSRSSRVRLHIFYLVIPGFCVLQCLCTAAYGQGAWQAPAQDMTEDIPAGNKQIVREDSFPMIGNGPWTVQFNLALPGDIQVVKQNQSLGKITRIINDNQQGRYRIAIAREIDPILGAFDAYAKAKEDLHHNIYYNETRNDIQKSWNRDPKENRKEAVRYLRDNKISINKLNRQEIRDLCIRMWSYDKKRGDIIRQIDLMSERQKAWKINKNALAKNSTSEELARKYLELHSLELIKNGLTEKFNDDGWQNSVRTYLDRLGVTMPADPVKEEQRLLQKIDALQIGLNGRFGANVRNKKRFNAALNKQEKDVVLDKITFQWKFSMWPLAHPADPNSWIKAASPVPASFKHPAVVNLELRGTLSPSKNDMADWWEVAGFDTNRLAIVFDGKRKAELIEPQQVQAVGNQRKRSLIRVVAKGKGPVNYVITIRSKDHNHDPKKASVVYEPVANPNPGSPY
jgi:hypothetical protein